MRYLRGFLWQRLACALTLTVVVAACDNGTGQNGIEGLDVQDLDIDFDTLDVDVQGVDIAGYLDVLKQDTIGGPDVAPDVDAGGGTDVQTVDVPTVDVPSVDVQPEDVPQPDVEPTDTVTADAGESDMQSSDTASPDVPLPPDCTADDDCADANACTLDTCDSAIGKCLHTDVGAGCTDGNPCTSDGCDPATGCAFLPTDATCTDNNACTYADSCMDGVCVGAETVACNDGLDCTIDSCDIALGCTATAAVDNTSCEDGNACTTGDACVAGTCVSGEAVVCLASDNTCTTEVCDPTAGCVAINNAAPCTDGNVCTLGDVCGGGTCLPGEVTDCADGNACTVDTCLPAVGCANDVTIVCDDKNACTQDACEPATGCTATVLEPGSACDDTDKCTESDVCSAEGVCVGTPSTCDDESACSTDSCDPAVGCVNLPDVVTCDDGNPCTTGDLCDGFACIGGYVNPCDDKNPCTADSCTQGGLTGEVTYPAGCVHSSLVEGLCDDGNPCSTYDYCYGGACVAGSGPVCDDGNDCTNDACNEATQNTCTHFANADAYACQDGNQCTLGDYCDKATGACVAGPEALPCFDEDPCTLDVCDPLYGCLHNPTCDDGDACTADYCDAGACSYVKLALFRDDFSKGNAQGWTLDETWEIGAAKQSLSGDIPPGDPAEDHSPGKDNQLAGVVIGGLAPRFVHPMFYLTSPEMDTTTLDVPALEFWRWLTSDYPGYANDVVEVWDGKAWVSLWASPNNGSTIADTAWLRQTWNIAAYSNPHFRVRIGFEIGDPSVYSMGSWNIDDVVIGESGQCVQPDLRTTVGPKPAAASTKPARRSLPAK